MGMSGISGSDIRLLKDQFQQFKQGKFNLQKNDLNDLKTSLGGAGSKTTAGVDGLLASFDQIDTNADGISFKELVDFTRAKNKPPVEETEKTEETRRRPRSGGRHGHGLDLPPVSLDDLNAYKDKLTAEGKEVPPELTELIAGFTAIDGDKDGQVSFDEVRTYLKQTAPQTEQTGLSKDELVELKDKIAATSEKASSNLDSLISGFGAADTNKDGKIDLEELQQFLKASAKQAKTEEKASVASNEGLGILASLNRKPAGGNEGSGGSQASTMFLRKIAAAYNQLTQPVAASSIQVQV